MRKRNNFNLSHDWKLTGDMGYLYPIGWKFVNPGDIFRHSTTALIRTPPLNTPVMHKVYVRIHHVYCRFKDLWADWDDWYTGGEDGANANTHPYIQASSVTEGSLLNHLGIPAMTFGSTLKFNAFPLRCYIKAYNDLYRDSQVISQLTLDTTDGLDSTTNTTLQKCGNPKDYYSTLRAEPQLGDDVNISVGGEAPLLADDNTGTNVYIHSADNPSGTTLDASASSLKLGNGLSGGEVEIVADLANATGLSINDLRLSLALQRDREKKNLYGGRYAEVLRHEFGIRNNDHDGRAVYLGGGKNLLQYSEVLSTDGANTGDLYGHGLGAMKTNRYQKFFSEHGIQMTLMSVIPEPLYPEQCFRQWLYDSRVDYYDPDFEYIGEQEVTNREVQIDHSSPDDTFGYQKQFDEYRYSPNFACGKFGTGGTLNTWHYGTEYAGDAALNQSFIECTPTKRTQQDTNEEAIKVYVHHKLIAKRLMARNPMPKLF